VKRAARTVLMLAGLALAIPTLVGSLTTGSPWTAALAALVILAIAARLSIARYRKRRWARLARRLRSRALYHGPIR
jgi:membrane protein implicated in regulation of membrane protease activity